MDADQGLETVLRRGQQATCWHPSHHSLACTSSRLRRRPTTYRFPRPDRPPALDAGAFAMSAPHSSPARSAPMPPAASSRPAAAGRSRTPGGPAALARRPAPPEPCATGSRAMAKARRATGRRCAAAPTGSRPGQHRGEVLGRAAAPLAANRPANRAARLATRATRSVVSQWKPSADTVKLSGNRFKEIKHDLAIRPILRKTEERFEAHSFVAVGAHYPQVTGGPSSRRWLEAPRRARCWPSSSPCRWWTCICPLPLAASRPCRVAPYPRSSTACCWTHCA